jgi:heme A synthase
LFTLFWVCVQGAFGAFTVTLKLQPIIVSLHLLGAYGLLALLTLQVRYLGDPRAYTYTVPGAGLRPGCGWVWPLCCYRPAWAPGSVPITRCWSARISQPVVAAGGLTWTSPRPTHCGGRWVGALTVRH